MTMPKQHLPHLPQVLLWGGKSKARIIQEMLKESQSGDVAVIFDSTIDSLSFETPGIFTNNVSTLKEKLSVLTHYVVCMGGEHGFARFKTAEYLERLGLKSLTLIHHRSFIEPSSTLGAGCQVMPGAVVHKFSSIGKHTIINTNATVEHECKIGNGVHIMGNVATGGGVEIGDYATIGTNATVLPFIKIGEGAFVGAGAVVTKDVAPYTIVAGVPAKTIRKNEPVFAEDLLKQLVAL